MGTLPHTLMIPADPTPAEVPLPRILVVDDSPIDRSILMEFLEPLPCSLCSAENGPQALAMAQASVPDMILLDIVMPGMTGFEACRALKEDPMTSDVPVIFLTSRSAVADILEGFRAGAVDYVCKPYEPEELLVRIRTHLELCQRIKREQALVEQLHKTLVEVQTLTELIPVCSWCRRVRDDGDYWHLLDAYYASHGGPKISHGICPECQSKHFPGVLECKKVEDSTPPS